MKNSDLKFKPYGERAILVEWPQTINETILKDILAYKASIQTLYHEHVLCVNHAYCSLLIYYVGKVDDFAQEIKVLKTLYTEQDKNEERGAKVWRIPVCYEDVFALDIEEMANQLDLSKRDIISLHKDAVYTVYFIGFLPGFLYLGGLDNRLHFARKASPRLKLLKGTVAIGGNQTGIYPSESPGGWNCIGNSPINFFDISLAVPCFAESGDKVVFYPISRDEHHLISEHVKLGTYQLESEVIDD